MQALTPQNLIEEHFIAGADVALPMIGRQISRGDWGGLIYRWSSSCAEIGTLSVSVQGEGVTLSTDISHTHITSVDFQNEGLSTEDLARRIAEESVAKAAAIMAGEIAFTETFDGKGQRFSSGICRTEDLREGLRHMRKVFGQEMTERAFTWFGQVLIE